MKGIFIYYKKINYSNLSGIDKKVLWQLEAFRENGIDCELVILDKNKESFFQTLMDQFLVSIPYGNRYPEWKYSEKYNNIDFIYFRRPTCFTVHMLKVFSEIKENNPKVKTILEIPTYPYDKEMKVKLRYFPLFIKDIYNRSKLHQIIDRIAVQNDIDTLFSIPTINFTNGIKVDDIKIRQPLEQNDSNQINLCAVASLNPWQGYERVIQGIFNYYENNGKRNIVLHLVGDGSERQHYERLVKDYKLENSVLFYGSLFGEDLNKVYNICDLALDAFGRYKTENSMSTSLKSREYLAKGIPIVSGCKVDLLEDNSPYYLEFPSDSSSIDMNKIVKFYDEIYGNGESKLSVAEKIRKYAYKVCDVSTTMKDVVEYIKN
ncbi:glycosyl transferase [Paraliobacillus quinghaiensis]|uniref:Glycosyl transferase n=1 Tax=Paraliobacillus quinghaiensis TaxID=470815 RepID=A0A917WTX2_9BACI|nr:glycosyltransferase [Paraliobacillus quinghaiensis]GGM31960.1 glycosyl transferase [Paraliobacillus quinghaiensis]